MGDISITNNILAKQASLNTGRTAPSDQVVLTLQDNEENAHKLWFVPNAGTRNYNSYIQRSE